MIDYSSFSISFLPLQMTGNPLVHVIEPVDPAVVLDRSSLRYQLYIDVPESPGSTAWRELVRLDGAEKPPVISEGSTIYEGAYFQIDRLLDGFLSREKPQPGQTTISALSTLTMPYRLRERVTGGDPEQDILITRAPSWCIKAGLSPVDHEGWGGRYFDVYQQSARRFLTNQPDNKTLGMADEEYLYFLLNVSPMPTTVKLRAEISSPKGIVNADGVIEKTLLTLANPAPYSVLCVPVGPKLLGADVVTSYRVWLANENNEAISEVRTYWIDQRQRATSATLIFNNSLGGYDCVRLLGDDNGSLTVARTSAERTTGEAYVVNSTGTESLTIATGLVERDSEATLAWWKELLLAEEWYLVDAKGHLPLILQTDSLSGLGGSSGVVSASFSFKAAQAVNYASSLPPAPTTAKRPTAWRGVGFRHVLDAVGKRTGLGMPLKLRLYYLDDGTDVKPIREKPNAPGADYIAPTPVPGIVAGTTPYPSAAISRAGSYLRANCAGGLEGSAATITVEAGRFGGESQADADALAEAYFRQLDTQEYANQNGSCSLSETYTWSVPAGQWHVRMSPAAGLAIFHNDGSSGSADMGNVQSLADLVGTPFVYAAGTRDMDFPAADANWLFYAFGQPGAAGTVSVYRTGALLGSVAFNFNSDGFQLFSMTNLTGAGTTVPASGDRWFIRLTLA